MKRVMIVVIAVAVGLTSCQAPGPQGGKTGRAKTLTTTEFSPARVVDVQTIEHGQTYYFDKVMRLTDASEGQHKWKMLVGPNLSGGTYKLSYSNTEPDLYIEDGWAYIIVVGGLMPGNHWGQARTDRVSLTADGTGILLQEENGVHRAALLTGPNDEAFVKLYVEDPNVTRTLTQANTYFEVTPSTTALPTTPNTVQPDSAFEELINWVEGIATIEGMD